MKRLGGILCLDFVNTIGGWEGEAIREERLESVENLLNWGVEGGLLSKKGPKAGGSMRRAHAFRGALHRVCTDHLSLRKASAEALKMVEREIQWARGLQKLRLGTTTFAWQTETTSDLETILAAVALSAEELLTGALLSKMRECPGGGCGWLFLDQSRNGSRRWCDMRDCGNVAKVRRFRELR